MSAAPTDPDTIAEWWVAGVPAAEIDQRLGRRPGYASWFAAQQRKRGDRRFINRGGSAQQRAASAAAAERRRHQQMPGRLGAADARWLAGVFDSGAGITDHEGSLVWDLSTRSRRLAAQIYLAAGCGRVIHQHRRNGRYTRYRWRLQGTPAVQALVRQMRPHLRVRHEDADLWLAWPHVGRGGRLDEEILAERRRIQTAIAYLDQIADLPVEAEE